MRPIELLDRGVRKKVVIKGENYYLYISPTSLVATVPRENDPNMQDTREIVEAIANAVTEVRENL